MAIWCLHFLLKSPVIPIDTKKRPPSRTSFRLAPGWWRDSACWFLSLRTWRKRFKVPKQLAQCNASSRPLRTPGSSASIQPDMSCFFAPSWPCWLSELAWRRRPSWPYWRETMSSQLSPVIGLPSPRYLRIHLAPKCNRTLQDGPPPIIRLYKLVYNPI